MRFCFLLLKKENKTGYVYDLFYEGKLKALEIPINKIGEDYIKLW
jgi:hypothetical protein